MRRYIFLISHTLLKNMLASYIYLHAFLLQTELCFLLKVRYISHTTRMIKERKKSLQNIWDILVAVCFHLKQSNVHLYLKKVWMTWYTVSVYCICIRKVLQWYIWCKQLCMYVLVQWHSLILHSEKLKIS